MKNKNSCRLIAAVSLLLVSCFSYAETAFVVENIEIQGNDRTDPGTVLNYLPVRVGDQFDPAEDSGRTIRALYKTGLFTDVKLRQRNKTLIVDLKWNDR